MSDQLSEGTDTLSRGETTAGRTAATIALAMFMGFAAIVILLHLLRPDTPPLQATISDYATGEYGMLMPAAFLAWAVGLVALAAAVFQGLPLMPRSWVGLVLLSISSVLMVLIGIFRGDLPGSNPTSSGALHDLASLLFFLLLMIAMLVYSIRLRRAGMLSGGYAALLWLSIAAPPLVVATFAFLDSADLVGLGQRIFVLVLLGWLALIAFGIRNRSFEGAGEVLYR